MQLYQLHLAVRTEPLEETPTQPIADILCDKDGCCFWWHGNVFSRPYEYSSIEEVAAVHENARTTLVPVDMAQPLTIRVNSDENWLNNPVGHLSS